LYKVEVDAPLENKMLKRPYHILQILDNVLDLKTIYFKLVFYYFHSLNLVGVVVPNAFGGLLNAY
jgi:hypothetical protein